MINHEGLTSKKIQETANLFKESRVLLTAIELKIFTVLNILSSIAVNKTLLSLNKLAVSCIFLKKVEFY